MRRGGSKTLLRFEDGSEATIQLTPWSLGLAEEKFGLEKAYGIRGMLYAAWTIVRPGVPFDMWGPTVVEMKEGVEEADPQPGEADSATVSPD